MTRTPVIKLGLCVGLICGAVACGPGDNGPASGAGNVDGGGVGGGSGVSQGGSAMGGGSGGAGSATGGTAGSDELACLAMKTFSCPAVDGSKVLSLLSAGDAASFCDCLADYTGGYGAQLACNCPNGSPGALDAPSSQATCLANPYPPACGMTISQFADCMNLYWAKPCDDKALYAAFNDTSCAPVLSSYCI